MAKGYLKQIILAVVLVAIVQFLYKSVYLPYKLDNIKYTEPPVNYSIKKTIDDVNKRVPIIIDSTLTFTGAVAYNKGVQYNYTLKLDTNKYDLAAFKKKLARDIYDNVIWLPKSKPLRDSNVVIIYNYSDTNNQQLFQLVFDSTNYKIKI